MEPAANKYRSALHNGSLPDGPLTLRQRCIADAVRGCHALADFAAAPAETVTAIEIARVAFGTSDEMTAHMVRRGIAHARQRLDEIEGVLAAYGGAAFAPKPEPLDMRFTQYAATRHEAVTLVARHLSDAGLVPVRAGDRNMEPAREGGGFDLKA